MYSSSSGFYEQDEEMEFSDEEKIEHLRQDLGRNAMYYINRGYVKEVCQYLERLGVPYEKVKTLVPVRLPISGTMRMQVNATDMADAHLCTQQLLDKLQRESHVGDALNIRFEGPIEFGEASIDYDFMEPGSVSQPVDESYQDFVSRVYHEARNMLREQTVCIDGINHVLSRSGLAVLPAQVHKLVTTPVVGTCQVVIECFPDEVDNPVALQNIAQAFIKKGESVVITPS